MSEPLLAMSRRNTESGAPCDTQKGVAASGGMTTHMLLLQCPSWFDGVEVGRVGREVEDANPEGGTELGDSWVAVSREVVHHEHVTLTELWQELPEPHQESESVGRREHRAEEHPPTQADGAEHRQIGAPVHRRALDVLGPLLDPGMAAGHGEVQSGLINEDESFDGNRTHFAPVGLALRYDVGPKLFERPDPFFFTTKPARCSARLMLET